MSAQPSPYPQAHIQEFDSLRGLAALLIVLLHISSWNPLLDIAFIKNGYLMVELFFVLSGFVMAAAYGERIKSMPDLARFQFLRLGRLYPLHALFLSVFFGHEAARYVAIHWLGFNLHIPTTFDQNNLTALLQHLLLIQAIGPAGQINSFNIPSWSISVEFYTYLIFGLIALWLGRKKYYGFTIVAGIALMLILTHQTYGFDALLRCLAGFFIGSLTAAAAKRLQVVPPTYMSSLLLLALLAFLQFKPAYENDSIIFILTAGLLLCLALRPDGLLNRILKRKTLVWLGALSYAIYMSHTAVIMISLNGTRRIFGKHIMTAQNDPFATPLSMPETQALTIIVIALILLVSWLAYILVERPMRAWSRRIVKAEAGAAGKTGMPQTRAGNSVAAIRPWRDCRARKRPRHKRRNRAGRRSAPHS